MNARSLVSVGILVLGLGGCSSISPELLHELAQDDASLCFTTDIRGGVGTITAPSGGYGQSTLSLCRSKMPDARVSVSPEGAISIEHGKAVEPAAVPVQ
jgi:hypothetical protein